MKEIKFIFLGVAVLLSGASVAQNVSFTVGKYICLSDSVQFTNTSDDLGAITSIDWDFGDGTHVTDVSLYRDGAAHLYVASGEYIVTLVVCWGTNAVTITVADKIEVQSVVNPTTCGRSNGSITLTVTSANSDNISYEWVGFPDTINTLINLISGVYTVKVTDSLCRTTLAITVPQIDVLIEILVRPAACGIENGEIRIEVENPAEPITYKWYPNTNSKGELLQSDSIGFLKAGTYYLHFIDGNNCVIDTTITVPYADGPIADFVANTYYVPINTIFTLHDKSDSPSRVPICTQNWNMGDGNQQTGNTVRYSYKKTGDYLVRLEVTDTNGCIDSISKIIHVYDMRFPCPNPTTGLLYFDRYVSIDDIVIFDMMGRRFAPQATPEAYIIDISHLAGGVYFLRLEKQLFKVVKL